MLEVALSPGLVQGACKTQSTLISNIAAAAGTVCAYTKRALETWPKCATVCANMKLGRSASVLQTEKELVGHSAEGHDTADIQMQQAEQQGSVLSNSQVSRPRSMTFYHTLAVCLFCCTCAVSRKRYANLCCLVECSPC